MDVLKKLHEANIFQPPSKKEEEKRTEGLYKIADWSGLSFFVPKLVKKGVTVVAKDDDSEGGTVEIKGDEVIDAEGLRCVVGEDSYGDSIAIFQDGEWVYGGKYAMEVVDQDGQQRTFGVDASSFALQ